MASSRITRHRDEATTWRAGRSRDAAADLLELVAEHGGHGLAVVVEGTPGYAATEGYTMIGGDEHKDIPFERYLAGWAG